MTVKYLTGNEKVLELGANIGRNSLIISYILNCNNPLITLYHNPIIKQPRILILALRILNK
jgi:hypothetical protein